jgi:hypothetical protein
MKTTRRWAILILAAAGLYGQDPQPQRITVPFSDPSRPRKVKIHMLNGGVTVKGYDGKDVIVEAALRSEARRHGRAPENVDGLKRIGNPNIGLDIEEQNNVVSIGGPLNGNGILSIQVPFATSLEVKTLNGGNIEVDHVSGEIDANNLNGAITLTNVSGSVLAHSLNGKVVATLDNVTPDKPMSFSTMNGNIDVTLPGGVKANVKMKSDNGDVYSDFDIKLDANRGPVVEDSRGKGGKYKVKMEKAMSGSINGGGPEIQFTTFNGNIMIRKK